MNQPKSIVGRSDLTPSQQGSSGSKIVDARETFSTLLEMSKLLNTGLDAETLAICVRLCEQVSILTVT